jgi:hypothetical protein
MFTDDEINETFNIHISQKEYDDLTKKAAELQSLKMSINESKLKVYSPERPMSFHDKVVFALDKAIKP